MKITLIGLGVREGDISLGAKLALDGAGRIIARTGSTESFASLRGYAVETLDGVYEKSRNFDTLNKNLASAVLKAARDGDVCYCVDGAVSEDESCKIIAEKCGECSIFEGVSKSGYARSLSNTGCGESVCVSAYGVKNLKSCRAASVYDIDDEFAASEVKAKLSDIFGEESECFFVRCGKVSRIKIYEIDRQKEYDGTCAVTVCEGDFLKKERYDYADLERMIKLLRAPDGCPWDRAQTSATIKSNMIEEAYELVDAIERDDEDGMEEETGDVLLQAAFHSVLEEEKGGFTGADALTRVVKKLIFRHSHIFGKDKAADEGSALSVWEKNKREEKGQKTFSESVLAVPANFPSCMYAQKVQKRAAKSGMDFLSAVSASEKLFEEVQELIDALVANDGAAVCDEAGDVLFSAVNVCRHAGVDCEDALRGAVKKFTARFVECERLIVADGRKMEELDELELDVYWRKAKSNL